MKWILTLVPDLRSNVSARGSGFEASIDSDCEAESDPQAGAGDGLQTPPASAQTVCSTLRRDHPGLVVWSAAGADSG